jgi:hypothetical protein
MVFYTVFGGAQVYSSPISKLEMIQNETGVCSISAHVSDRCQGSIYELWFPYGAISFYQVLDFILQQF